MAAQLKKDPCSLVLVMSGYFSILVGKIDQAKVLLYDSRISERDLDQGKRQAGPRKDL
ncbi:MAG: hypothetical protein ABSH41_10350 [Syntrophobacteraceae bacterium]|jgi:hypothetical protein